MVTELWFDVIVLCVNALLTQVQSFWTPLVFVNNLLMYRNHGWNELALLYETSVVSLFSDFFFLSFFLLINHVQYVCFSFVNSASWLFCLSFLLSYFQYHTSYPILFLAPHRHLVLPGLCFTCNLQSGMSTKVLLHVYCTKYSLDIAYFQRDYQCYSWPLLNEWWWWWWTY